MTQASPLKKNLINIAKLLATVLPFILILGTSKFDKIASLSKNIPLESLVLIAAISLSGMALQGIRWWYLLRVFIKDIPLGKVLQVHFKAIFYSIAVPSALAQDVIRAALFSRESDYKVAWGASWVARVLGMAAYIPIALTGWLLIDKSMIPGWINYALIGIFVIIAVTLMLSFSKKLTRPLRGIVNKIIPLRIMTIMENIREGIYMYRGKILPMAVASVLTLIMQVLCVSLAVMILDAVSGHFFWKECFFFIPAIETAVVSVPITPNGMGIREGLTYFFMQIYLHLSPEQISLYVIFSILVTSLKLAGCISFLPDLFKKIFPSKKARDII